MHAHNQVLQYSMLNLATVWVSTLPIIIKKTVYQQVLKLGANEACAQGLQNAV
jgi:hypothetical protein